jgi:predicted MFS family arabinose efflux permease
MARAAAPVTSVPGRLVLPALCLGSFVTALTFVAPGPFLPAMSRDLGVSVALLGQVTAAMMIMSAMLGLVAGPLADRYGSRRLILVGIGAAAVCLLDFGLAPVFALLFIASIAGSLAEATVPGLSLAIAGTQFSGAAARRAIGWTIGTLASAPIIGVPILTTIGDAAGWRVAFIVAGVAAVVVMVLVAFWLPRDGLRPDDALRLRTILHAYRPLLHHTGMRRLYASTVTRSIFWFGLLTYFGALMSDRLGLRTGEIGLVYMLGGAGYLLGSVVAGGPLARVPTRPLVSASNAVSALVFAIIYSTVLGTSLTIAIVPLTTFAAAAGYVGLTTLLTEETPAGPGTTMVLNGSLFNLGAAIGAAAGGYVLAVGGFGAVAVVLPLFGLISALLVWTPRRQSPR